MMDDHSLFDYITFWSWCCYTPILILYLSISLLNSFGWVNNMKLQYPGSCLHERRRRSQVRGIHGHHLRRHPRGAAVSKGTSERSFNVRPSVRMSGTAQINTIDCFFAFRPYVRTPGAPQSFRVLLLELVKAGSLVPSGVTLADRLFENELMYRC